MKTKSVSLYVFYNMEVSKDGSPFALCDKHRKEQKIPDDCTLRMIAKKSIESCIKCEDK